MARTGRFGRLPRSAPNLTATIVGLVREMNAQEDSNLVKAWNEGGQFKGKPVTDDDLLKHLQRRRDSIGRTDPLWDHWDTLLKEYTFAIEESKVTERYSRKAMTEMEVAAFYTDWAKKLPTDSEAYRDLMRSAAQFLDAWKNRRESEGNEETQGLIEEVEYQFQAGQITAGQAAARIRQLAERYKDTDRATYYRLLQSALGFEGAGGAGGGGRGGGGGGGRSSGAAGEVDVIAQQSAYDRYEANYDVATYALLTAAYREGILSETDTEDPDDLMDLRVGDEEDHARFLNLFDQINSDPRFADLRQYLTDNGVENLTYSTWVGWSDEKATGIETRLNIAVQGGASRTEVNRLEEELADHTVRARTAMDLDEYTAYQRLTNQIERSLSRPGLNPWEEASILERYRDGLEAIYGTLTGNESRGFFNNLMRNFDMEQPEGTGPTPEEANEGGIRGEEDAAGSWGAVYREVGARIQAVESGQAYMYLTRDEEGNEVYDLIGHDQVDESRGALVWAPTTATGPSTPLFVEYLPIFAQAAATLDPNTGRPLQQVQTVGDQQVGSYFTLNGRTYYGVPVEGGFGGEMRWFAEDSPFNVPQNQWTFDSNGALILNALLPSDPGEAGFNPRAVIEEGLATPGATNKAGERIETPWANDFGWRQTRNRVFNPSSTIQAFALDDELPRERRFNNPDEAAAYYDPEMAAALVKTSRQQLATFIAERSGGDPLVAEEMWEEARVMRDNAVAIHNRGVTLAAMEAQKYGLGTYSDLQPRDLRRAQLTGPSDRSREQERVLESGAAWEEQRLQQAGKTQTRARRMAQGATATVSGGFGRAAAGSTLGGLDSMPSRTKAEAIAARTPMGSGTGYRGLEPIPATIKMPKIGGSPLAPTPVAGPRAGSKLPTRRSPAPIAPDVVKPPAPTPVVTRTVRRAPTTPVMLDASRVTAPTAPTGTKAGIIAAQPPTTISPTLAAAKTYKSTLISRVSAPRYTATVTRPRLY